MARGIHRIAVVNRGEAAMRLVNAVRERRAETGEDLVVIALHTTAERRAMFVRESDEAICLDDLRADGAVGSPYLDLDALESALVATRADAAWVGWGFVAERPEFADLCDRLGVTFVGPSGDVMRRLGDKIGAKLLAERADVPVAPWSGGPVDTVDDARRYADRIGYPLMVKATAGGGGRGIRRVDDESGLAEAFESARSEAAKAFGDATVFVERVVSSARHVEVQIVADEYGTVWAVGVRDCSLQRRNQKVIEESHCVALTPAQDTELRAAAVRLARSAGYCNAGTVEFLYQPASKAFAFLEVNTRLQVEHPVTELTTGLDLVKMQLHVAAGGRLEGEPPPSVGFAIEARLNAEDPQQAFAPAPGRIEMLTVPVGPGIRVDTGVAEGDVIPPEFDSMIAKIIATGRTRDEAIGRLHRALEQTAVVINGGTTNKSFLLELLDDPDVRAGTIDTSWLDRRTANGAGATVPRFADVALVAALLDANALAADIERTSFLAWAARGRPRADGAFGRTIELRQGAERYAAEVGTLAPDRFEIELDDVPLRATVERLGRSRCRLCVGGRTFNVLSSIQGSDHLVEVDGTAHRFTRDDAGVVRAPAAALVIAVEVAVDDIVRAGSRLGTVEAMKMELPVRAPVGGRIRDVFVARNVQVDAGAPMFRIEPEGHDADGQAGTRPRIDFGELALDEGSPEHELDDVVSAVLGFDVTGPEAERELSWESEASPEQRHRQLIDILACYCDLVALAPERRSAEGDASEREPTREVFRAYLRTFDAEREGLPDWFGERLSRAVAHYGVAVAPSSALHDAVLRIFLAHERAGELVPVIAATLDELGTVPDSDAVREREALDLLVEVTRRRVPALASLGRAIRYHRFDRRHIHAARAETARRMEELADHVGAVGGDEQAMRGLINCPLPLMPILSANDVLADAADPGPLLEVLTRRYYRIREVGGLRVGDDQVLRASYDRNERTVNVLAARVDGNDLDDALRRVAAATVDLDPTTTAVVDLYLPEPAGRAARSSPLDEATWLATTVRLAVAQTELPSIIRRITVVAGKGMGMSDIVTFRRLDSDDHPYWMDQAVSADAGRATGGAGRFEEDAVFRGLHPMIARRLQLWRLANFYITRLPSGDDVNLFDCTARTDATDRRLIAVAEVRDLTPVRDENGNVVAIPDVEHALVECLDAIREARDADAAAEQLGWNRVLLHVWPPVDLTLGEMMEVARRLAPLTEGLGLEQVIVSGRIAGPDGTFTESTLRLGYDPGRGLTVRLTDPPDRPMAPVDDYTRRVIQSRRRGLVYPYEIVPLLRGVGGTFVEYDLDDAAHLTPVERPPGANKAGVVVGVASTPTELHPDGMTRVAILGDSTKAMGSITEAECVRVLAAIDLAVELDVPVEWFALSAGAKIAMDSGSENLDWVARVLRRLVEHTQAGGEVNIVVAGINVGAQPYWNAEATMLMHTKGILVMTPDSAMVLTGKQAIDYSGGVSAEDNFGIGGYERIMGPNGEAQYFASTLAGAVDVLFHHYDLTYRAPGRRWPRRAVTLDPTDRDVRNEPQSGPGVEFRTVGDLFSTSTNPDRKKPFDARSVMRAVIDRDHPPLERWPEMAEAATAVVWDARIGGYATTVIGIESRPLPRHGVTPADGPDSWSPGTLFPLSSKKVARAINAASGERPVVVLANLSGFDGSPESLRRLQLEYGAEIGRAIVNFEGPIVLCVISRYHGGAFVVFSATLNDDMEVLAVEGSFASVIGGAPAAAVVFTRDVDLRTAADPRVRELEARIGQADESDVGFLRAELDAVRARVRTEKLGEVADEFDAVHSVQRAHDVGSVHRIIQAERLRPEMVAAVERGIERTSRPPG